MAEILITEAELKQFDSATRLLSRGVERRAILKALMKGAGVAKRALIAADWPVRTGVLKKSFRVKKYKRAVGVGAQNKTQSFGRRRLKSGRLGKVVRVTAGNQSKVPDQTQFKINPAKYLHLIDRGTKRFRGLRLMEKTINSKRRLIFATVRDKMAEEIDREVAKVAAKNL